MNNSTSTTNTFATSEAYKVISRTSVILALSNAFLALLQIVVAYMSSSHALFADAMHTFSDLFFDIITYFAGLFGSLPPDKLQPYGYRRLETMTAILLAMFLTSLGVGILYSTWLGIGANVDVISEYVVLCSLVSIVLNEALYRYTRLQAESIRSQLLMASATHQRSDALSSVVVFLSACLDVYGLANDTDYYGAIFIGLMIIKMGGRICVEGLRELMDAGMDSDQIATVQTFIESFSGIEGLHLLRSRKMAGDVYMDVHVITEPYISVSEGHYIGEKLRQALKEEYKHIADITVHIDPEDDEDHHNTPVEYPDRSIVIKDLLTAGVVDSASKINNCVLRYERLSIHYINQEVQLELLLSLDIKLSQDEIMSVREDILTALGKRNKFYKHLRLSQNITR